MGDILTLLAQGQNRFQDNLLEVVMWIFVVIGAIIVPFAIYLGFKLANASDENKRRDAKTHFINVLVSFIIIMILVAVMATIDLLSNLTPSSAGYGFDPPEVLVGSRDNDLKVTFDNRHIPIDESKPWEIVSGGGTIRNDPVNSARRLFDAPDVPGNVHIQVTLANGLEVIPILRVVTELTSPPSGGTGSAALIAEARRWIGAPYCFGHHIPARGTQPPSSFLPRIHFDRGCCTDASCGIIACTTGSRNPTSVIAFDSGSFTLFVYRQVYNITIGGRTISSQRSFIDNGNGQWIRNRADLRPGDLVFAARDYSHVELYYGDGQMIGSGLGPNGEVILHPLRFYIGGRLNISSTPPVPLSHSLQSRDIDEIPCTCHHDDEVETSGELILTLQKCLSSVRQVEIYHERSRTLFKVFDRLILYCRD
jgi:cell wall-associated NlpC family hydrolase